MDIMDIDPAVVRDARSQLEKAARLLAKLENADTATAMNQQRASALLSDALANIHAAEARLA